ncbi:nucleotidyltransferase domain-containing protein [Candidatus Gottesmanbacteria bacterium]|nr:nucleotidyltransferase domain-containing protein [Candidatus Gottesmanbacteria bacterium]
MSDIQEEAKLLIQKIVDRYKPEKVILFGSLARGNMRNDSDIDLLIVKNSDKKRPFRVKDVFEAIRGMERRYSLDAIVYTPAELEKRIFLGDYFINRVLAEGKVVYGRS